MATTKLQKLYNEMESAGAAYVKAYNEGKLKKKELKALKDNAKNLNDNYNLQNEMEQYRLWAKEGDPVRTAVRVRKIDGAKRLQYKTDDDDFMTLVIKDAEWFADLTMLEYTLGTKYFANKDWFAAAETLAYMAAGRIEDSLLDDPRYQYKIADGSKKFKGFKDIDFLTDAGFNQALNVVFDAVLFMDDGTNHNIIKADMTPDPKTGDLRSPYWNAIEMSMTRNAGPGTIKVALCNTQKFIVYILDVMHTIATNGNIKLEEEEYWTPYVADLKEKAAPATDKPKADKKQTTKKADK